MTLDNLTELTPTPKSKLFIFQRIALGIEIALASIGLIGILLKTQSWAYASEILTISFMGLSLIYVLFPILIFKSKKAWGHVLVHVAGLFLFVIIIGALFKVQSWTYAREMIITSIFTFPPIITLLLILIAINFREKDKLNLYLRIGLRLMIILIILLF
jgi:hypothetical protein